MVQTETVTVESHRMEGVRVQMPGAAVLMLVGRKGFLGCGYFRIDVADKVGHALAVVTGVATFDDMLAATVRAVSKAAEAIGIREGMSGAEAAALLA